jgi:hypothetical protein
VQNDLSVDLRNFSVFLLITGKDAVEFGAHARVSRSPRLVLPHDYTHPLTRETKFTSQGIESQSIRTKSAYPVVTVYIAVSDFLI